MTDEEYDTKAMLLGMERVKGSMLLPDGDFHAVFRKRVSDGRFFGTALFSYFYADTLEPIAELQNRSEVDLPLKVGTVR